MSFLRLRLKEFSPTFQLLLVVAALGFAVDSATAHAGKDDGPKVGEGSAVDSNLSDGKRKTEGVFHAALKRTKRGKYTSLQSPALGAGADFLLLAEAASQFQSEAVALEPSVVPSGGPSVESASGGQAEIVEACCDPTPTQVNAADLDDFRVVRFTQDRDPFWSGAMGVIEGLGARAFIPSVTQNVLLEEGADFQYSPPATLGTPSQLASFKLVIPNIKKGESAIEYDERRFQQGGLAPRSVTLAKSYLREILYGSTARVYFPASGAPSDLIPFVLKLRFPFPWLKPERVPTNELSLESYADDQEASRLASVAHARKDLVVPYVLDQCAKGFRVMPNWQPLIQVEEYQLEKTDALRHGIFFQRKVDSALSAFELANQIYEYEKTPWMLQGGAALKLNRFLARFEINGLIEARRLLALLEKFYEITHLDLIRFEMANHLVEAVNYVADDRVFEDYLMRVGADYNRGSNALWSKIDHRWHIIDF